MSEEQLKEERLKELGEIVWKRFKELDSQTRELAKRIGDAIDSVLKEFGSEEKYTVAQVYSALFYAAASELLKVFITTHKPDDFDVVKFRMTALEKAFEVDSSFANKSKFKIGDSFGSIFEMFHFCLTLMMTLSNLMLLELLKDDIRLMSFKGDAQ